MLLFAIYAGGAAGIAIKFHYCQGRLANVSILNFDSKPSCPFNASHVPKGCCKDQLFWQSLEKHNFVEAVSVTELSLLFIGLASENYAFNRKTDSSYHKYLQISPIRRCPEPIYLLNRVLLI
jgi:hypothetical protein